jgi:hypothetical protein
MLHSCLNPNKSKNKRHVQLVAQLLPEVGVTANWWLNLSYLIKYVLSNLFFRVGNANTISFSLFINFIILFVHRFIKHETIMLFYLQDLFSDHNIEKNVQQFMFNKQFQSFIHFNSF